MEAQGNFEAIMKETDELVTKMVASASPNCIQDALKLAMSTIMLSTLTTKAIIGSLDNNNSNEAKGITEVMFDGLISSYAGILANL